MCLLLSDKYYKLQAPILPRTYLFNCKSVTWIQYQLGVHAPCFLMCMPTISSLHIGQTMRELAAAAACAAPCSSRAMRDVRSSFSVDIGVLEVCELRDTELSEGDSKPGLRTDWTCLGGAGGCDGGARLLPDPRTRPPPRLLLADISGVCSYAASIAIFSACRLGTRCPS